MDVHDRGIVGFEGGDQAFLQDRSEPSESAGGRGASQIVMPDAAGVVILPPGTELGDIRVEGRDLVVIGADGVRYVIPDGAIIVPQLVIDDVAIPPLNLAALLIGNEPQPAAGNPQSSGGNFASPVDPLQDAYDLGDLLPYTELSFPQPEEREVLPAFVDREPEVVIVTPDQPAGAVAATATVHEAGLPGRGAEPAGTNAASSSETTTGTIAINAPDGLVSVTIGGVVVTTVGQTFPGTNGTLTITSISAGAIGYSYTLADNLVGQSAGDTYAVAVTDRDGDVATASLTVDVLDDAPIANDDADRVAAGTYGPETGNVITGAGTTSGAPGGDQQGADGARLTAVTGFGGSDATFDGAGNLVVQGQYGVLAVKADGSYTFVRTPGTAGGVTDSFTYTLTDADGSTDSAVLTITIEDSPAAVVDLPTSGAGTIVDEAGLPPRQDEAPGTQAPTPVESTSGTIVVSAPDGIATVQIGTVVVTGPGQVIPLPQGNLTIDTYDPATGTVTYTFTLTDNTAGDSTTVTIPVTVTDVDGDTDTKPLVITILDDTPEAIDDSASQSAENAPVTVDVFANDIQGADSVQVDTVALVPGTLSGTGQLTNNGDGTFTYVPGPGEQGTVTFDYAIVDGDGDRSEATVTIALLQDSTPSLSVTGGNSVDEAALGARADEPAGSNESSTGETASGNIAVTTGGDSLGSLVINGIDVTAGGTVSTQKGVLTVGVSNGAYSYSYTLTDNTLSDPDSDTFSIVATDSDGDSATTSLVIAITDDRPSAADDAASLAAGAYGPIGGNVLANDTQGADGARVANVAGAGGNAAAGVAVEGAYGTLQVAADGTFTYVRNPGSPGGVTDTFTYTIVDGDGDTASATLVISIPDSGTTLTLPTSGQGGTLVFEEALATGSNPGSNAESTSGSIAFTAPDGPAAVTIDGQAVAVGTTIVGAFGTLVVDAVSADSISYTYTLTTNTNGDNTADRFTVRVEDRDGDSSQGELVIDIRDDVPTARPDADFVSEDGRLTATGNVVTDTENNGGADTAGADGASVTAVSGPAGPGAVGSPVAGQYGTLTMGPDGTYSYTLDNSHPLVQGLDSSETLSETFTYTLTDGDGDPSASTLVITIRGADDGISITGLNAAGPEIVVDEDDLATGSSPDAGNLTKTGTFVITAQDGIVTIEVGGLTIYSGGAFVAGHQISTAYGTLTFTAVSADVADLNGDVTRATVAYSYTLNANTADHSGADDLSLTDAYTIRVTDSDGTVGTDTLEIQVIDDVPTAADDSDAIAAGDYGPATGNVITDAEGDGGEDTTGADGAVVTSVTGFGGTGTVTGTTPGQYGTLVLNADGSYEYTRSPGTPGGVTDTFQYAITDADGDTSVATLSIAISDAAPVIAGNAAVQLDDDAFPGGNPGGVGDAAPDTANLTGTLSGSGGDGPLTWAFTSVSSAASFTATIVNPGLLEVSQGGRLIFTVTLDPATGDYTVVQNNPYDHPAGLDENDAVFSVGYTVSDIDSDTAAGTLTIQIGDDTPSAYDNAGAVTEGGTTGGNVLTDGTPDIFGADGGSILSFASASGGPSAMPGGSIATALGTLTIHPDGSYSYVSNANSTGADTTDTFTYTIIDGDGDTATATLVIAIDNVAGNVFATAVNVNEAGLDTATATGSDPASNGEFGGGAITVTGATGPFTYTLIGANSDGDGLYGSLVLDNATGTYSYALDTPFTDTVAENTTNVVNGAESFAYEVRDAAGNLIGTGTIAVNIIDDVPVAVDEPAVTIAEDLSGAISGNVLANDTPGADGATLTHVDLGTGIVALTSGSPLGGGVFGFTTAQGTYTFAATGAWTFDPADGQDQSSGPIDASFTYRLTDSDGDFDDAVQPITIVDGAGPANPAPATLTLDDQNLADGSTPAGPDSASHTITFVPGSDPFVAIAFGDTAGLAGGLTWTRVSDTLIEGSDGGRPVVSLSLSVAGNDATVTATLIDNYLGHTQVDLDDLAALGAVTVVATDTDGDQATANVTLQVSDDLPTLAVAPAAAGALTVDETLLATDATANFAGLFAPDYNADGPGGISGYTLGIKADGADTGLVDTGTGERVLLHLEGNRIVGRTETSNLVVFELTNNGSLVTLNQQRAVSHGDPSSDNEASPALSPDLVTLSAVATDSDGDTARAVANIGGAIRFLDDGPSIQIAAVDGDTIALITQDADTIGGAFDSAAADFSGAFALAGSSGGADGTQSISWAYALVLDVASGAVSGLTSNGQPIYLHKAGATVVGSTSADPDASGAWVFDITVDQGGTVTLRQYAELDHDAPGSTSAFDLQTELLPTGLVSLEATATITDGDNDTAVDTARIDLGGNIRFADHGPTVSVTGAAPALIVDESDLATNDSKSFANVFTIDYGADGPAAAGALAYTLSVKSAGALSGLTDTATGNQVYLFVEAGQVVGREGTSIADAASGDRVFTVSVDAAGVVTLDQIRAVVHSDTTSSDESRGLAADDLIVLSATAKDGDLDTATGSITIGGDLVFKDDGPTAGTNAPVRLDDDTLAGGNPGGTGDDPDPSPATVSGVLSHSFGSDGGAVQFTAAGAPAGFRYSAATSGSTQTVQIHQEQGAGNWVTVSTVTLNTATGAYTVTQNDNVLHADGLQENNQIFTLGYAVRDGDNDVATGTIVIDIDDDTPTAAPDTNTVVEGGTVTGDVDANDSYGADGPAAPGGSVVGVRAGSDTTSPATGGLGGAGISSALGTLTLNADGTYTYKSFANAVTSDATDTFVYTIRDADGDLVTTTLTVTIDDVTLTGATGNVVVYEKALDTTVQPGDVAAGSVTGSDPANTGETATGNVSVTGATSYGIAGGTDNGATITMVGTYGTLVIVKATGAYTYTLTSPYSTNPAANDGVTTADNAEAFTYTATDAHGNSISGIINIDIVDDVPLAAVANPVTIGNAGGAVGNAWLDSDQTLANNLGADGGKAIFTSATIDALQGQNLTSGLSSLNYTISADGTVLTANKTSDGSLVFTLRLEPAGFDDKYVIEMAQPLDAKLNVDFTGNAYDFTGGNTAWAGFIPDGEPVGGVDNNSNDLLLTPGVGGVNASTINQSTVQYGVGSGNSIGLEGGAAETFRLDFVTDLRGNSAGSGGYGVSGNRDHAFDGHYQTNGATVTFTASNGTTLRFAAYDDLDGNTAVGDGVLDTITGVALSYEGLTTGIITPTTTLTTYTLGSGANTRTYTVKLNADGTVDIGGLYGTSGNQAVGTVVAVYTDTAGALAPGELQGYNSLQFTYVSGAEIKVGNFGTTVLTDDPVNFTVPISLVDGDGDQVSSGNLAITLNPVVPPVVVDLDGDGAEFLGAAAGATFDYAGDGTPDATAWASPDDGILGIDLDGDGAIGTAAEFVFGGAGHSDLEALATKYDDNGDGVLDASDQAYARFGVWQDGDSDGVSDPGEFASLAERGITAISLTGDNQRYSAADGEVVVSGSATYTRADGTTGSLADAAFMTEMRTAQRTAEVVTTAAAAVAVAAATSAVSAAAASPAGDHERSGLATEFVQAPIEIDPAERSGAHGTGTANEGTRSDHPHAAQAANDHATDQETAAATLADVVDRSAGATDHVAGHAEPAATSAPAALFGTGGGDGVMQALLALAPEGGAAGGNEATAQAAIADAMSDVTGSALVDAIVDHFAGGSEPAIALAANDTGSHLLTQVIGGSGVPTTYDAFAAMADADAHALAAAQA
ncbi:tandem-95 repeat protein [Altererythrobacter aerius]|uniref:Tandem-95 repeat protein n=1 Tax=Tsuneonella aeria TaxID=1837929 RepID=A0A6I4TCQ0_9SPHN|nr:DUF5801 repeats-in-toxin domain-containing protein [Tsuneonella aeria]MXO73995.1 tandem-95 repeat protein [Tsuneonella aeria]